MWRAKCEEMTGGRRRSASGHSGASRPEVARGSAAWKRVAATIAVGLGLTPPIGTLWSVPAVAWGTAVIATAVVVPAVVVPAVLPTNAGAAETDDLAKRSTWSSPAIAQVKLELEGWVATRSIDDATRGKIVALWPEAEMLEGPDLLDRLVESAAIADPAIREWLAAVRKNPAADAVVKSAVLADDAGPGIVRNNLRLLLGRQMTHESLYDEALDVMQGLEPNQVVDPASLLFYQSVGHHRLLQKDKCLPVLARLMENEQAIPRRYLTLAKLMDADLRPLKPDSLDEIARMMDDIHRRLDLGRAGTKVRKEEDDVIAKLDKMIEDLEKQQQQQQQQQSSGQGGGSSPSSPRADSGGGGMKGAGNVDPKNIGKSSGWGDLPAKDRQEVLQQISKDLPAHYRETIEEYFRKLARDGVKK